MKTTSPKNLAIGLLLLTNVLTGAYLFARQFSPTKRPQNALAAGKVISEKKGSVQEGSLKHNGELQKCYDTFLARNPIVDEGVVEMHWLLQTSGQISSLELVRTELPDQELMECMMSKLTTMTFRAPQSPVLVAHKFNLKKRTPSSVTFH